VRFSNILVAILPPLLMITAVTCTREVFIPPSASDVELTLSSEGQGPQVTTVDSSDVIIDGPGRIDFIDPDSTRDDTPPTTVARPETVLDSLSLAYRTRSLDLLAYCLAPIFRYYTTHYESEILPAPSEQYWDREQEIAIHQNMFDPEFQARQPFRGADFITVSFTILQKESHGYPSRNRWKLICHAVWNFCNTQMAPKPFGIRHEGDASFVIGPDPEDPDRWLIETWWEEVGQTRFIYQP
jgi:hypothetical protein